MDRIGSKTRMKPITVRFQEEQHYDIQQDCEVVRFMATTNQGSYWTEIPLEGPRSLRRDRERFKELAVQHIQAGSLPAYIEIPELVDSPLGRSLGRASPDR